MNRAIKQQMITAILLILSISASAQSPYIHKVYDFMPAPGQFVNKLPEYEPGDTREDMIRKAEEAIAHNERGMISLGGYGGYVIFGFDHLVKNVPGKYDFKVLGNAFYADANPNGGAPREGGSCEPGIVMVSYDTNNNGLPDDEWYELAGSEYRKSETIHNYEITYYRPDENKLRDPDPSSPYINDRTYIRWTTNGHGEGYLFRNTFHHQSYYPQWIDDETLTFTGTRLADNYVDESGTGAYYVQYAYPWGYVDNHPNTNDRSGFDIEWAVDKDGNPVQLPGIHFVKVYTAVNQYCGWLGETSTEVLGAEDLHLDLSTAFGNDDLVLLPQVWYARNTLHLRHLDGYECSLFTINGQIIDAFRPASASESKMVNLQSGIYILAAQKGVYRKMFKLIK